MLSDTYNFLLQFFLLAFRYLQFFRYNSICLLSDRDLLDFLLKMPALDRNVKVACDNCGTLVSKQNVAKHKKKCSVGTLYCSQCPNHSTKSQNDLNYHIAKKHGAPTPAVVQICMVCKDKFTGFYALRHYKSQAHGQNFKTSGDSTPSLMVSTMKLSRKNYVRACQHICLLIRSWKKDVREFSILHWIHLVLKKSTQSRIMSFNNSNVLKKLIWFLALC